MKREYLWEKAQGRLGAPPSHSPSPSPYPDVELSWGRL
jgi:hypothetical protein